jgi:hypothetical protein
MDDRPLDEILEALGEEHPEAVTFDDLDDAIVGIASQWSKPPLVVYDYEKIIECFMKMNDWSYEEAQEWTDFNVVQVWAGEGTPLIMMPLTHDNK